MTKFASKIGNEFISRPYTSQKATPAVIKRNIPKEISFVLFVLYTLIACGTNEIVVHAAAIYPKIKDINMITP